jgi:divalent metal cation (Fe/Co/Zn/Cd) transporter
MLATAVSDRGVLMRRARRLAWAGNAWHVAEFAVALAAGLAAGSIALVGFGLDSLIELASGTVVVWLFTGRRIADPERSERRARRLIAAAYLLLAAYIAVAAGVDLATGARPDASWLGIALAAVSAVTMPPLARAKRRVGDALDSRATVAEGGQNMLCAYLALALLVGLSANALLGAWWADPLAALAIAAVAAREGIAGWNAETACGCGTQAAGRGVEPM